MSGSESRPLWEASAPEDRLSCASPLLDHCCDPAPVSQLPSKPHGHGHGTADSAPAGHVIPARDSEAALEAGAVACSPFGMTVNFDHIRPPLPSNRFATASTAPETAPQPPVTARGTAPETSHQPPPSSSAALIPAPGASPASPPPLSHTTSLRLPDPSTAAGRPPQSQSPASGPMAAAARSPPEKGPRRTNTRRSMACSAPTASERASTWRCMRCPRPNLYSRPS